jgi:hypothetical protein
MNSKYYGSMGLQRLIREIKLDTNTPGADTIGTSQIINESVTKDDLSTQLQDFIDGTKTVLSVSKINLILNNAFDSSKPFNYNITFTDENSNVTNHFTSAVGIFPSSSQSVLLSIATPILTTTITIAIDSTFFDVTAHSIGYGATEIDFSIDGNTTYLTFLCDTNPTHNVEVYIKFSV